jgi:hypothetical protein
LIGGNETSTTNQKKKVTRKRKRYERFVQEVFGE